MSYNFRLLNLIKHGARLKTSIHITEEKIAKSESPWTEGDIPIRKGNCNILVIAPHGHKKNDENTYEIARHIADDLDCYLE